jgi:hypothetical protein
VSLVRALAKRGVVLLLAGCLSILGVVWVLGRQAHSPSDDIVTLLRDRARLAALAEPKQRE